MNSTEWLAFFVGLMTGMTLMAGILSWLAVLAAQMAEQKRQEETSRFQGPIKFKCGCESRGKLVFTRCPVHGEEVE